MEAEDDTQSMTFPQGVEMERDGSNVPRITENDFWRYSSPMVFKKKIVGNEVGSAPNGNNILDDDRVSGDVTYNQETVFKRHLT